MRILQPARVLFLVPALLLAAGAPALAGEAPATGWADTAEFSLVATAGNSESTTLGLKDTLARTWETSTLRIKAGAVRAESTTGSSVAVGLPGDFRVIEPDAQLSAESYFLNGRYDRKITARFFWYAGTGWERNRFAGIENRYVVEGGVGNVWFDREDMKFRTDYALTWTDQEDVLDNPSTGDSFAGARFSWAYLHHFGKNSTYENTLALDENLDETSDFRADMVNSVAVAMSNRLALKLSLQWLYDNQPSLSQVDLFDAPPDQGGTLQGQVPVELDELDTIFTASLVVNF